ncbi:DUF6985 domain-containing protein [Maribacter sp. 2-571]|uniref:DUF6985 domain-containing protein n=1 Tax=Maribacter sp. 2-571 TaxID=3417569 RepID=UPI003D34A8D7
MIQHSFWGEIVEDWAGFSPGVKFVSPYFPEKEIKLFLGTEYDEDGEEIEIPPTTDQLDSFQKTYSAFIDGIDTVMEAIKAQTFERYLGLYAHYYENETKSGTPPLGITTMDKHFVTLQDVLYLRILDHDTIKIPIHYTIDTEHGLEIKLNANRIVAIGGIAET